MPLSRRAQDPRVGYVAIMVCDVLTHLMKAMLKERRAQICFGHGPRNRKTFRCF